MINRVLSASLTLAFLAFVRPDVEPSLLGAGITAILLYEGLLFSIGYIQRVNRKHKKRRNIAVSKQDIKRWADERLAWPIFEEVS